jgi:hypothetical protein
MDANQICLGCMAQAGSLEVCPSCGWRKGTAAASPLYLAPGTVLNDQYLVGRTLGHGGFGITYLGWDAYLARKIALKEYFPSGVAMRTANGANVGAYSMSFEKDYTWGLERYLEEARVLARFQNHPNIVAVQNFFRAHGTAYMVLEFLDGVTLEAHLERRGGRIDWDTALMIMLPAMDALREVHGASILHRDISPDNIYILRTGQVKVIDFGAARYALGQHSKNLSVILKPGYAPVEQYLTRGIQGPWTDVYATAATLYRAITGVVPQPALDRKEIDEVALPSSLGVPISPAAEQHLMRGLALRGEDRWQDMGEFERALMSPDQVAPAAVAVPGSPARTGAVSAAPVVASHAVHLPRKWLLPFPNWMLIAGAAVAALIVVVGLAMKPKAEEKAENKNTAPRESVPVVSAEKRDSVAPALEIAFLRVAPEQVKAGEMAVVDWSVKNASEVTLNGERVGADGRIEVRPEARQLYTLMARAADGTMRQSTAIVEVSSAVPGDVRDVPPVKDAVRVPPAAERFSSTARASREGSAPAPAADRASVAMAPPQIAEFGVYPPNARPGSEVTLRWYVAGAESVTITPEIGQVSASGAKLVQAERSQTFRLVAQGPGGTATSQTSLQVTGSGAGVREQAAVRESGRPKLNWYVSHDHSGVLGGQMWMRCEGTLSVMETTMRFQSRTNPDHSFEASFNKIKEVKTNRMPIAKFRAFHVTLRSGGNYNFVVQDNPDAVVMAINEAIHR